MKRYQCYIRHGMISESQFKMKESASTAHSTAILRSRQEWPQLPSGIHDWDERALILLHKEDKGNY